jgi:dGTPase
MLEFKNLFSDKRTGKDKNYQGKRSEYQRDFDRLIFSSAFRRLQNKTQVFPLPGSTFVHNRLTHSLEVSTVGRSLGKIAGEYIATNYCSNDPTSVEFYKYELQNVIAAACLAHDIGNPAFGHSGESAISNFFTKNEDQYKKMFGKEEWADLTKFEGNANALRILTHQFEGNLTGGQRVTYTTLATILKYPCESTGSDTNFKHLKKYGFFQTEKMMFEEIVTHFGLIQESSKPIKYCRHPFVYLLEAADDITYTIIDFEDAHRLGILDFQEIYDKFYAVITCINRKEDNLEEIDKKLIEITNKNEKIAYLRSRSINSLILQASDIFNNNINAILNGKFNDTLIGVLSGSCTAFKEIEDISISKIYNHRTVVEIELAGYNVMYELLQTMIPAVLMNEAKREKLDNKAINLIPQQFGKFNDISSAYEKSMGVIDYVSGMTDLYATEMYRKIKGIEIGKHS